MIVSCNSTLLQPEALKQSCIIVLRRESKGLAFVLAMQELEGFAGAVMDNAGPKRTPYIDLSRAINCLLAHRIQSNL